MDMLEIITKLSPNVKEKKDILKKIPFLPKEELEGFPELECLQQFILDKAYGEKMKKLSGKVYLSSPGIVAKYFIDNWPTDQESFHIVTLNTKKRVIATHCLGMGSLDLCVVDFRKSVKECIMDKASCVILVHNHPSNDPTPSEEDIELTKNMAQALGYNFIEVLDHIIVGIIPTSFYSFAERYSQALEFKLQVSSNGIIQQ